MIANNFNGPVGKAQFMWDEICIQPSLLCQLDVSRPIPWAFSSARAAESLCDRESDQLPAPVILSYRRYRYQTP